MTPKPNTVEIIRPPKTACCEDRACPCTCPEPEEVVVVTMTKTQAEELRSLLYCNLGGVKSHLRALESAQGWRGVELRRNMFVNRIHQVAHVLVPAGEQW